MLEISDIACAFLGITYHLDEEVGEGGARELGILAPVEVAVIYCFFIGGVSKTTSGSRCAAHFVNMSGRSKNTAGTSLGGVVVEIVELEVED